MRYMAGICHKALKMLHVLCQFKTSAYPYQISSSKHVSSPVKVFKDLSDCHGCYHSDDVRQTILLLTES